MIIKICGMTDGQNIREAERLKPDMMGFVCWLGSRRCVRETPSYLPAVARVGVFVNPCIDEIVSWAKSLKLNRIQLHGNESPAFCNDVARLTRLPVTKALPVSGADDIGRSREYSDTAVDMFLFDTSCAAHGGSGRAFDWSVLRLYDGDKPFLLAGGIGPDDASRILSFSHPRFAGIDLNSRFESAPGVKDIALLKTFFNKIQNGKQD